MFTALAVTSMTNFILASEAFFFSGLFYARSKATHSAAWFWQFALLMLSTSALLGGLDHGFFEVFGDSPFRNVIEHSNWFLIGLLTLLIFLTTIQQFFAPRWRMTGYVISGVQLVIYIILTLTTDTFLVVILNYAPVMLLLLICNFLGLKPGTGSWSMIIGILVAFIASGLQAAGVDVFSPLDRNSLYHLGMMIALIFLYLGGLRLSTTIKSA